MKRMILIPLAAVLLSACSSFKEDVAINSVPQGADVFLGDELVGQTPMNLELNKDGTYEIRLAKKGYKDQVLNLASIRQNPLIKFGPLVDMGYYKELTPAPVDAQMKPGFLPEYPGLNSFDDMTYNIIKVDEMRKRGIISAEEHSYLLGQITQFYSQSK